MTRPLNIALAAIAGSLLLLASLAGFLLLSETGLQLLWQRLEDATGTALSARSVQGRLAGSVRLEDVHYQDDRLRFSAAELQLDWSPLALLHGLLHIDRLAARGLKYEQGAADPEAGALELPAHITVPLRTRLEALELDDASITTAPEAAALQLRQLRLRVDIRGSRLGIENLVLETPGLAVQGAATLEASGDYPLQGEFDWRASPAGYAPVAAHTRVDGSLQLLRLQSELQPPYDASAGIELVRPLTGLLLSGELALRDTDLAALHADWPALRVTATLHADGTPQQLQLDASFSTATPHTGPVAGTLQGLLQPGALELAALRLAAVDRAAALQARGRVEFDSPQPVFELQADWQELSWPLQGTADVHSTRGELTVAGSLQAYTLSATAILEMPAYSGAELQLAGTGNLQSFELAELGIVALDGTLDGRGRIDWSQDLVIDLALQGKHLNPALVLPEWPGLLDLQLDARVKAAADSWQVQFDTATARGTLRGFPLQLDSRGSYSPGQLLLGDSRLVSGPSRLQLSGAIGSSLALAWELDSPDLATLLPTAAGRLTGKGEIHGTPAAAVFQAALAGSKLRYRDDHIDRLSLDTRIDLSGRTPSRLALTQGSGSLAGVRIDRLEVQGSGSPQSHRLAVVAATGHGALDLDIEGNWIAPDWHYRLTRGRFAAAKSATSWQLQQPVSGVASSNRATLPENCWSSGAALACLRAGYSAQETSAGFRIEQLPLAYLLDTQETGVGISGTLQASADLVQRPQQPLQARLELHTSPGQLVLEEHDDRRELLRFGAGTASIGIDRKGARLDARLPLEAGAGGLFAEADIAAAERPWTRRDLHGVVSIELPDIAFARALSPEVSGLHGHLDGQVKLSGTLAEPQLLGKLRVADAGLELATPGLTLSDVAVEISGQEPGRLNIDARARSGDGTLAVTGQADLSHSTPAMRLQLSGEQVQVMNTPEAEIHASPDLAIALDGNRIDVSGEVRIPRARIEPRKLPESAVTVSPDQVIVAESGPKVQQTPYAIYSQVRFILGDDIRFEGLGLSGMLRGNVLTSGEPGRPASATGELSIRDGRYRAYGQDLEIRTGRLLFAGGALTEPGLDIDAARRPAPDILVGVKVRGNLNAPALSVFSEPGMPQSQQLSWLILGRDLESNTSAEEKSTMNEVAMMLGVTGGETLGKQLGEQVGLDEVSISSEPSGTTTQASLLVGKYLTPELFVSYGIGIFEPVSTLRLLYTVSSHWKLVGEASELGSAADIFYVIERGK